MSKNIIITASILITLATVMFAVYNPTQKVTIVENKAELRNELPDFLNLAA
jgi:hypothetical protein